MESAVPAPRIATLRDARARGAVRTWSVQQWRLPLPLLAISSIFVHGNSRRKQIMEAFTVHHGTVMPLDRINVNTDDILPARYLTAITRSGYAHALFTDWRYLSNSQQPDPTFELNMP